MTQVSFYLCCLWNMKQRQNDGRVDLHRQVERTTNVVAVVSGIHVGRNVAKNSPLTVECELSIGQFFLRPVTERGKRGVSLTSSIERFSRRKQVYDWVVLFWNCNHIVGDLDEKTFHIGCRSVKSQKIDNHSQLFFLQSKDNRLWLVCFLWLCNFATNLERL